MTTLKILFWICLAICVYTYVGYGLLLYLLVLLKRLVKGKPQQMALPTDDQLPDVSFMVCAYNEQDVVEMKMQNIHELDYPKDKLHVVWVTDGSSDNTNEYLKAYPEVEVIYSPERRGKTAALNHGLSMVKSDITVMTDANTMVNREAIREIVRCMQDPKVACVAGEKRVLSRTEGEIAAEGEGLYWKYESTLKRLDSELYSAMGAAGELNAIRTNLYEPMPETALLDDFVMSMRISLYVRCLRYGVRLRKSGRRVEAQTSHRCWWTTEFLVVAQHDEPLQELHGGIPVCLPSRPQMEHHAHCPDGSHSTQCGAGDDESRNSLHHHLDTADFVLSVCILWLSVGAARPEKQVALCALLFPLYEHKRLPWHALSEDPPRGWSMGESKKRIKNCEKMMVV